jgi:hypothetical protein
MSRGGAPPHAWPKQQSGTSDPRANIPIKTNPGRFIFIAVTVLLAMWAVGIYQHSGDQRKQTTAEEPTPVSTAPTKPTVPPPNFRIYRSDLLVGTSIVVSTNTTDEQLRSLLWLFREKVRSHRFNDIGITQPTSEQRGKKGYLSGMLTIYRGTKCAGELFSSSEPCGDGDHSVAIYQWGLLGDDHIFDSNKDSGAMVSADGTITEIFNYKDHWRPEKTDVEKAKEAKEEARQTNLEVVRQRYVNQLQNQLRGMGYDITVSELGEKLILSCDIFKDTSNRVQFLAIVRKSRRNLCEMGFRQVHLMHGGLFDLGNSYSLGCN